jgi:hypothetical protein
MDGVAVSPAAKSVRFDDHVDEKVIQAEETTNIPPEEEDDDVDVEEVTRETILYEHALLALHITSLLFRNKAITASQRGALKDLIVRSDDRVMAACALYEMESDMDEFLDTLQRLALVAEEEIDAED